MAKVLIGIQARSGSQRLPNKVTELILGKTILDRVIGACKKAAFHVREEPSNNTVCQVVVLTPTGDPVAEEFKARCAVLEGSNDDVLSRYVIAANKFGADYIVRITGDCPLIPHHVIARHIILAITKGYDYISNVFEIYRTSEDGVDCEVMSRRLLEHIGANAKDPLDREHVTTFARRIKPEWAKYGHVINHFDQSHIKYSVDTKEDLERVRSAFEKADAKYQAAVVNFGNMAVHRI